MKKILLTIVATTVIFCLLTMPLMAVTVEGTGYLLARGNGRAALQGSLRANIHGDGTLSVKDNAGDAEIDVDGKGRKKVLEDGTIVYTGLNGHIKVSGTDVTVKMDGRNIKIEAHGTGKAVLQGRGEYRTKKSSGRWTLSGADVEF